MTRIPDPARYGAAMEAIREALTRRAEAEGFAGLGICAPEAAPAAGARLTRWLADGQHGSMSWMESRVAWRADPRALWEDVRSVILVAEPYAPPPLAPAPGDAAIAAYACGPDYHDTVKRRLKRLAGWLQQETGCAVKVFVDTAPVMEKPLAEAAGLGWQGKHTNLVSTRLGSWFLLGAIFTTLELPRDQAHTDRCGSCRRCLDVCPTAAFPAPYRLDARRCISYLTIELKTPIPRPMRPLIGNRIFGCDDCLAVCPWNRFAARASRLPAPPATGGLRELARLDDAAFRARYRKTPLRRTGRNRFLRNVLTALGNARDPSALPEIEACTTDPAPLVRGAAIWTLARILPRHRFAQRMEAALPGEGDAEVSREWRLGHAETVP